MQGIVERALLHEVSPLCYHLLSLQHCSKRLRGREGGREEGREEGREGGREGGRDGSQSLPKGIHMYTRTTLIFIK